ncbi:hypothetical protein CEXT_411151 [Caerostris extrusa]|uniref:Uncharacterized protein n=1 Tax=Caerostris extrusa TaxID=172846 RepID=A0AAV4XUW7_CAEEX|nr:hypothetical protein CEXT_411151 [Caerostris extrusa]
METPTCINCGKQRHLTSWRGCIKFPKFTNKYSTGTVFPHKRTFNSKTIDEHISFADALKTNSESFQVILPHQFKSLSPLLKILIFQIRLCSS